jgi:predicted enzyme related to lactoylglutathione lyase
VALRTLKSVFVSVRLQSVVVDVHDCEREATFWSLVLGWPITYSAEDEWVIQPSEGSAEAQFTTEILFNLAPDEKTTKNRLHFDLLPEDRDKEVDRIVALGATHADIGQSDVRSVVLADPEGNEFCVLAPLRKPEQQTHLRSVQ